MDLLVLFMIPGMVLCNKQGRNVDFHNNIKERFRELWDRLDYKVRECIRLKKIIEEEMKLRKEAEKKADDVKHLREEAEKILIKERNLKVVPVVEKEKNREKSQEDQLQNKFNEMVRLKEAAHKETEKRLSQEIKVKEKAQKELNEVQKWKAEAEKKLNEIMKLKEAAEEKFNIELAKRKEAEKKLDAQIRLNTENQNKLVEKTKLEKAAQQQIKDLQKSIKELEKAYNKEKKFAREFLIEFVMDVNESNKRGDTVLHSAARSGDTDLTNYLVQNGSDITIRDRHGNTVMHHASISGNVELVTSLLESGLQIDCMNNEKTTPLMTAAEYGKLDVVKLLEKRGSQFRALDKIGGSVLHYACRSDNVALVTHLLDSGLQIECVNYEKVTPLMIAAHFGKLDIIKLLETRGSNFTALDTDGDSVLHYACRSDNVALVTHLLDSGLQIDCVNNETVTPLMTAAQYGKLDIIKLLGTRGSNFTALSKNGDSVLHYACMSDNVALVTHLLDSGLQIDCVNNEKVTPVMTAARYGKLDTVKLLETKGCNFTALDKYGDSVLHYACISDNVALVTYLLDSGLHIDCVNYKKVTPLMTVIWYGKLDVVKLLEKRGSNFTALDKNGDSVLHYACRSDNVALVTHLLNSGLQIDCVNYDQVTPVMSAAQYGKLDVVKLLEKRGSNFTALDKDGDSVLHYACKSDNVGLVTHLLDSGLQIDYVNYEEETSLMRAAEYGKLDIVKLLVTRGSNFTALDKYGYNVLHHACRSDNVALVTHLLDSGLPVQIDCVSNYKVTPLMTAAWYGNPDIVKFLMERGSKFDGKDNEGRSALWMAAHEGHLKVVQYLCEQGADLYVQSKDTRSTPLHVAAQNGYLQVVEYLVEKGAPLEVKDYLKHTPLDFAVKYKYNDISEFLRQKIKHKKKTENTGRSWFRRI